MRLQAPKQVRCGNVISLARRPFRGIADPAIDAEDLLQQHDRLAVGVGVPRDVSVEAGAIAGFYRLPIGQYRHQ